MTKISELSNPRQTILVTTRYNNKDNIITLDWHTPLSFEPMLYAIAVGKSRFSLNLIKNSKVFAVNFMPYSKKEEVLFCGRHSGQFKNKFKEAKLEKEECQTIDCPAIKDSCNYLECEVINEIKMGDHILFIGKVAKFKNNKNTKRLFHISGDNFTTTI